MLAVQDISNSIYNDEIVQGKLVMVSWRRNGHNGSRANAGEISRIVIRRICDDILGGLAVSKMLHSLFINLPEKEVQIELNQSIE